MYKILFFIFIHLQFNFVLLYIFCDCIFLEIGDHPPPLLHLFYIYKLCDCIYLESGDDPPRHLLYYI